MTNLKYAFCFLLLLLFVPAISSASASKSDITLLQIVSLDCQNCAKMSEERADRELKRLSESKGIQYRVGAFGPISEVGGVTPHPLVDLFWAATPHNPEKGLIIAEIFYRSFSEDRGSKKDLIDDIAIQAEISKDKIRDSSKNKDKLRLRWSKTAGVASKGMSLVDAQNLNTPAFALLEDGEVTTYKGWQGSVESTKESVKGMIENAK